MEVKAKLKFIRMSPRKTRMLADVIKDMPVTEAMTQLQIKRLKAAPVILKLLKSATANAEHNESFRKDNLYIKTITVDGGPVLKRYRPRAHGRAGMIRKPTCHIEIVLAEIKPTNKDQNKKSKTEEQPEKKSEEKKAPKVKKVSKETKKLKTDKSAKTVKPKKEVKQKSTSKTKSTKSKSDNKK